MRTRTAVLATAVALTAAGSSVPALAGKPKPPKNFTQNVSFTDNTPDPTGNKEQGGNQLHCNGVLPQEKPIEVAVPGPGSLDVVMSSVTGDWALQIKDANGDIVAGDDVNPPDAESSGTSFKKAQKFYVLPCNLAGAPTVKVAITYTYHK